MAESELQSASLELRAEQSRGLRCPYCHDAVSPEDELETCEGCQARQHAECWELHSGCAACGRRAQSPSRTGPRGMVNVEGGSDVLHIDWGERQSVARRMGALLGLALWGLLNLVIFDMGLLSLVSAVGFKALDDIGFLFVLLFPATILSAILALIYWNGVSGSGRLRVAEDGLRIQRMSLSTNYRSDELLPWAELGGFAIERGGNTHFVTVEQGKRRRRIARAINERLALRIKRQLQAARARFHPSLDPATIQVRPLGEESA